MDKLNFNSLCIICENLELEDQFSFGNAYKRARLVLPSVWQITYKSINFRYFNIQFNENFKFFFRSIAETVIEFYFYSEVKSLQDFFEELDLQFPSIETLCMDFIDTEINIADDFVFDMSNRCPYVNQLIVSNNVTGNHIWRMDKLRTLKMFILAKVINLYHTERIFRSIPLKKLTFTKCLDIYTQPVYKDIFNVVLNQMLPCGTLQEISLDSAFFNTSVMHALHKQFCRLTILGFRTTIFNNYDLYEVNGNFNKFVKGLLFTIYKVLKEDFLNLLKRLPNLKLLHIQYPECITKTDKKLLVKIINILRSQQITEQRHIYCYGKGFSESDLRLLNIPEYITFHLIPHKRAPLNGDGLRFILEVEEWVY